MYCCKCGAKIGQRAASCPSCGVSTAHDPGSQSSTPADAAQEEAVRAILSEDQRVGQCHRCGNSASSWTWEFGLGKVILKKRTWGATAASVVASAVTLPTLGIGVLHSPGKQTRFSVLQLRLRLCDSCARDKRTAYSMHPSWKKAIALGYTEFFDANDLKRLQR